MGPTTLLPYEGRRSADYHCPRPGLNPRTLGPMASTLSTRKRLSFLLHMYVYIFWLCYITKAEGLFSPWILELNSLCVHLRL
jgi:hypothetical protein